MIQKYGRKPDSNHYKRIVANKKIAYITHLIENTNQLVIIASIDYPEIKPSLLDRFLILAKREKVKPLIFITKIDLEDKRNKNTNNVKKKLTSDEIVKMYQKIGYQIIAFSNLEKMPILEIRNLLKDKKTAIVGHSGVGKTSLINNIDQSYNESTNEISAFTKKGRHTTRKIRMHQLSFGGIVYDMPGLKEIALVDISAMEIASYYDEFFLFSKNCRYPNCIHHHENECEVKKAVSEGKIHPLRYENYLKILGDVEF